MEDNAHLFSDGVGGRNLASRKDNGASQVSEKGVSLSSSVAIQDTRSKEAISAARFYIFYGSSSLRIHSILFKYKKSTLWPFRTSTSFPFSPLVGKMW